jgi:uncharacterized protein YggE
MRTSILMTAVVLVVTAARAADPEGAGRGAEISVVGVAERQVKPSVVEISATLSADAELANDARVKERDARQKVIDSVQAKCPGVALEFKGISINPLFEPGAMAMARQQQIMIQNGMAVQMGQNGTDLPRRYGVTEQVRLVLKDTDKLDPAKLIETVVRLVDSARECGLQIATLNMNNLGVYSAVPTPPPAPLIICRAADNAAARGQAYKAAMEDARKKAAALADLSGVKLGKVIGIREMEAPTDAKAQASSQNQDSDITSSLLGELSLSVRLGVRFEIVN